MSLVCCRTTDSLVNEIAIVDRKMVVFYKIFFTEFLYVGDTNINNNNNNMWEVLVKKSKRFIELWIFEVDIV